MAAELLLHAKKADFVNLIDQLGSKFDILSGLLGEYQTLRSNVTAFIQDSDSNFQNMLNNVDVNIDAVKRAMAITMKSKTNLQKTVDQMDDMSGKVSTMMSETAEAAKNVITTAIKIEALGI
jgi:methyl-accepting chemotaxis protein